MSKLYHGQLRLRPSGNSGRWCRTCLVVTPSEGSGSWTLSTDLPTTNELHLVYIWPPPLTLPQPSWPRALKSAKLALPWQCVWFQQVFPCSYLTCGSTSNRSMSLTKLELWLFHLNNSKHSTNPSQYFSEYLQAAKRKYGLIHGGKAEDTQNPGTARFIHLLGPGWMCT